MTWAAVIVGGGAIAGSLISSNASKHAAKAQTNAANQSNNTQLQIYNQNRQDQMPWLNAGTSALNRLSSIYGLNGSGGTTGTVNQAGYETATPTTLGSGSPDYSSFFNSPDYQYALQQGIKANDASAAARGNLYSGGYGEALNGYAQGMATQNLGNYMNRLASIAGLGQSSAGNLASQGQNYANAVGTNLTNAGNATASGYLNTGSAINNGINQLAGAYGYYHQPTNNLGYAPNNITASYGGVPNYLSNQAPAGYNLATAGTGVGG